VGDDHKITPHHAAELAACFEAHSRRVFGFACLLAREDRALADDLVQATFEAAARYLHITPSAVSQRIKGLETAVGRVLLTRTKPVHPTPSGQTLLRVARQLQTITAEAAHELGTGPPGLKTVIPVAVNADSLATWFLPALAGVEPSCFFDLHRSDQDQTAELLRDGHNVLLYPQATRSAGQPAGVGDTARNVGSDAGSSGPGASQ